jgi:hypothetical protein
MSTTFSSSTSTQTYTVQQSDFLSAIAQKFYGDGSETAWRKIYEANKAVIGSDPTQLQIGMALVIPPQDSEIVIPSGGKDLRTVVMESAQYFPVVQTEAVGFDTDASVVLVTFSNQTIVVKTLDGGVNWRKTLETTGKVIVDEIFFLHSSHFWLVAQWQVEGTFPTLYWTSDFGETWQESRAVEEFLRSKEHITVNFAEGIRFQNENNGIVIAKPSDGRTDNKSYFLQTQDGGKTCKEIPELPIWYAAMRGVDWREKNLWMVDDNGEEFSVTKLVGSFPRELTL